MYAMVCGLTFLRVQAQMLPKNGAVDKSKDESRKPSSGH
jgi:hypothetical protein